MSFICHIHNYTEYNEEWNVFSAFNPSKWSSWQPTLRRSWGFGALLKGLTSVVDTSCQSRDLNPQPWVTSGFKSNALSIRPRLPNLFIRINYILKYIQIENILNCNISQQYSFYKQIFFLEALQKCFSKFLKGRVQPGLRKCCNIFFF